MNGRPQVQFAFQVSLVRNRLRGLAALPVVLIWACSGGSSAPGDPPEPSSTGSSPDPPPPVAASLTVSPDSARLEAPDDTTQFTAEVRDRNGNVMADVTVTWSSDAPEVATVDATGHVIAVGAGSATVSAVTGELSASATVTVESAPDPSPLVAASLTISPATAQLEGIGETVLFTAEVRDRNGNVMVDVSVTWSSDSPAVATVDAVGRVTAIGAGSATVTAETGALSVSATVTVETLPAVACTGQLCDREALVALYESTGGEHWVNSTHWLSDRPLDEWYGVYPDHDGRVSDIALFGNGLSGPIPPEIGKLSTLAYLNLSSNDLTGSLPAELGDLRNLRDLLIANTNLSGPVPRELGNLERLGSLILGGNRLSGPIPPRTGRPIPVDPAGGLAERVVGPHSARTGESRQAGKPRSGRKPAFRTHSHRAWYAVPVDQADCLGEWVVGSHSLRTRQSVEAHRASSHR